MRVSSAWWSVFRPTRQRFVITTLVGVLSSAAYGAALDIDANGTAEPLTDGILLIRTLFGFSGSTVTNGALGTGATRTDPVAIVAYVNANASAFDVDRNNVVEPLTDGVLIVRYLFGFRGNSLITGSVGVGATAATSTAIENNIAAITNQVTPSVTVTVNAASTHPISPYIYGYNFAGPADGAPSGFTLQRFGGNRLTAYNWENNASNAGSDFFYQNDTFLSASSVPGEAVRAFIAADRANGLASMITVQMQGLVAADVAGPVSVTNPPDLSRFKHVVYQKNTASAAAFTVTPPLTDANVYMDEFVWALDKKFPGQAIFGATPASQPVFLQLDNEPELWPFTHLEIQGATPISSDAYIANTIALAKSIKTQFPDAVVFGPVHYGFYGLYAWQGELAPTPSGNDWFPDKYMTAIASASSTFGRPLVDVYDFHWYSEATDGSGNRVTNLTSASLTAAQVQAIVQSPRSLWDPTYSENSFITSTLGGPTYILGRLKAKIALENPGMKLSITEYNNGGNQHIAGTIAQADNLGVFGAQGVFAATLWPLASSQPYIFAGFLAFRNFDGAGSNFGDIAVDTVSSGVQLVSVYASKDSTQAGRVVFVAINRSTATQATAIQGLPLSGTAHVFQMSQTSTAGQNPIRPVAVGTQAVAGSSLVITLPALSVTTIDVR